jgi:flavin reductase (DIM6/NTAB) family NADH-FMN oxidoreductase RutF
MMTALQRARGQQARGGAAVDRNTFLSIMSAFPSGVAVVTTMDAHGVPKGLTTTAVSSVSADPPMLLVCVARESRTLPALLHSRKFVVNLIAQGREEVCAVFASRDDDKFAGIEWEPGITGMPHLARDTVAWAECELHEAVEAGDHIVLIGHVQAGGAPDPASVPAVYFRRAYGSVLTAPAAHPLDHRRAVGSGRAGTNA